MGWHGCNLVLEQFALFLFVLTHLRNHAPFFFFLVPYSLRNFMTKFHNFSQLAPSDGNRLNRFVGFFLGRSDFGTI